MMRFELCEKVSAVLRVAGLLLLCGLAPLAVAEELLTFESEEQRERYQALIAELRCPQCQNQTLEDSDSPIAQDLRSTVYRLLQEERSDKEITDYLIARYGDFITYLPRVQRSTLLLWLAPLLLLVIGIGVLVAVRRQRRLSANQVVADDVPLSSEEQQKLNELLGQRSSVGQAGVGKEEAGKAEDKQ